MTKSEAIRGINILRDMCKYKYACETCDICYTAVPRAINALEKLEKIEEAFEKWRNDTGGIYGADDETVQLIRNLNQILNGSDEE